MLKLVQLSAVLQILSGLVLGLRLLLLWRRTRKLPELLFASRFLISGVLSSSLFLLLRTPGLLTRPQAFRVWLAMLAAGAAATAVTAAMTWRIFRPDRAWARALAGLIAVVIWAHFLAAATGLMGQTQRPWRLAEPVSHFVCYAWMATESIRYYLMLRRRLRLGLTDPVVVNRFALWGWSAAATTVMWAWFTLSWYFPFFGGGFRQGMVVAVAGLSSTLFTWLAFYPPAPYLTRIRQRRVMPVPLRA